MVKAFALTGRGDSTMRKTQGVASLALGWVLHWAFSPHLLNPKVKYLICLPPIYLNCNFVYTLHF